MSFQLIGTFENESAASEAYAEIYALLEKIGETYMGLSEVLTWWEVEIGQKYGFEWTETLAWMRLPVENHIGLIANHVFVHSDQKRGEYQGLLKMLQAMTPDVYLKGEYTHYIVSTMHFLAPDFTTATHIVNEMNHYFGYSNQEKYERLMSPWEKFYGWKFYRNGDIVAAPNAPSWKYFANSPTIYAALDALYNYQTARFDKLPLFKFEKEALASLTVLLEEGISFPKGLSGETMLEILNTSNWHTGGYGELAIHTGSKITLPATQLFHTYTALKMITKYLEEFGCTDILFGFTQD